ncbi:MAG TPA: hypothetical protein VGG41_03870 [Solirubrobacteraceae bacterium]
MPKFCRHGTLTERCPICHATVEAATRATPPRARANTARSRSQGAAASRGGLTVRRERRSEDDGYRSALAPGLRSTEDAQRLAEEISFAAGRLAGLSSDPPGLYAEVATTADLEQVSWLAFLIAYIGPLEREQPFAAIEAARTPWGELPALEQTEAGPRGSLEDGRGGETLTAYARFVARAGSQEQAITADASWSPQQRFERIYERLALPGLNRRARYDLLVTLGELGRYPVRAPALLLTEEDVVTLAAKRVFGIGDRLTLERRARELASALSVPVEALDLGLENWARAERITQGFHDESSRGESFAAAAEAALERAVAALDC